MEWYLKVLRDYAKFDGRARRQEYWMFVLFNLVIGFAIGFVEGLLLGSTFGMLSTLYFLAVFIPSIAVSVRRLHDTGRSGLWLLVALIPLIGWLIALYFMALDGEPGTNQYGPNPKSEPTAAAPV